MNIQKNAKNKSEKKTRACPVLSEEEIRIFSNIELYEFTTVKKILDRSNVEINTLSRD